MLGVLRLGVVGYEVSHWQTFLRGQGFTLSTTGDFDQFTDVATRSFQKRYHLDADGIVGNQTFGQAAKLGFEIVDFVGNEAEFLPALHALQSGGGLPVWFGRALCARP